MFDYTLGNYFRWGYQAEKPFSLLPDDPAQVKLWFDLRDTQVHWNVDTYRQEAACSAFEINERAKDAGLPVTLFVSGGIDSEAMVLAWLEAECSFTCSTIEFAHGLNQHEVVLARALCERHKISHRIIQVDPFQLWYNPPGWMRPYRLESGLIAALLYGIDRSWPYFQVFAGNPVIGVDERAPTEPYVSARKSMLCHTMAWIINDHPSVSFFHMYSPEQMWIWLNHPLILAWEKQIEGTRIYDFDQIKTLFYQMAYPEITTTRPKWTGTEQLVNHIDDLAVNQWSENRPFNPITRRPLAEVRAELKKTV